MDKLITHTGIAAPMRQNNVDTDAIIPKQFLKSIKRSGFGEYLFDSWRYLDIGQPGMDSSKREINENFVLNVPRYQKSTILITNENFGCGSSREHAVWALRDFGIRILIGKSFADIFYNNCFKNGLLPIILSFSIIDEIMQWVDNTPNANITINLAKQEIIADNTYNFEIDSFRKKCLIEGLDEIGLTLTKADKIREFENHHFSKMPWLNTN